jgi:hypothetical protein
MFIITPDLKRFCTAVIIVLPLQGKRIIKILEE